MPPLNAAPFLSGFEIVQVWHGLLVDGTFVFACAPGF
jgi:hypothetical protein